jgi:hypothetical protein
MRFIGLFNRSEIKNEPLKHQKVIYFPEISKYNKHHSTNQMATIIQQPTQNKYSNKQNECKELNIAYLSKKSLMNTASEFYGLFNAITGKLIAFVDFSNK